MIEFSVEEAEGPLGELATQQFLQEIIFSQRGVQIIELGKQEDVLSEIGETRLDQNATAALGERFGVTAYFYGSIRVSEVRPKVDIVGLVRGGQIQAVFDMTVTARMISTETGATLWTDSVLSRGNLAYISIVRGGIPHFDIRDREDEIIRLMRDITHDLTRDFRPSRQRM